MKLPVAESAGRKAASGFVPRENEPSTNQTRVISFKDIYYDYLIFLFLQNVHDNFYLTTAERSTDNRCHPDQR